MATNHRLLGLLLSLFLLLVPSHVFASVLITEVMYDIPGSDAGREWVEITNTGSSPVDITGYRLAEGGTNHLISVIIGTTTLLAGESAVIVDNTEKFLADWPNFAGTMYKSSFSLSNTGETVEFKDASLTTVDSITYASSGGAGGDGNSLHRSDNTLIPGSPDPGVYTSAPPAPVEPPAPPPEPAPTPATITEPTTTTAPAAEPPPATTSTTNTPPTSSSQAPSSAQTVPQAPAGTAQTASLQTSAPASAAQETSPTQQSAVAATHAETTPQPPSAKSGASASTKKTQKSSSARPRVAGAETTIPSVSTSDESDPLWFYVLGLAALIIVGVGGALYVRTAQPARPAAQETTPTAGEFEIE